MNGKMIDKAKELSEPYENVAPDDYDVFRACMSMGEFTEKRTTENIIEWLKHNIYDYFYWIEMEGESEANIKETLFDDLRKHIEEL